MSNSGQPAYSQSIKLKFLETSFRTNVCYLLTVSVYVVFRHAHPDNATVDDVKKALHDNDIDFNQLKYWYTDRCRELSVV